MRQIDLRPGLTLDQRTALGAVSGVKLGLTFDQLDSPQLPSIRHTTAISANPPVVVLGFLKDKEPPLQDQL